MALFGARERRPKGVAGFDIIESSTSTASTTPKMDLLLRLWGEEMIYFIYFDYISCAEMVRGCGKA